MQARLLHLIVEALGALQSRCDPQLLLLLIIHLDKLVELKNELLRFFAEVPRRKLTACPCRLLLLAYLELKMLGHLAQQLEHLLLVLKRQRGKLSIVLLNLCHLLLLLLIYLNVLV